MAIMGNRVSLRKSGYFSDSAGKFEIVKHELYTLVKVSKTRKDFKEMEQWCKVHECGKAVNNYTFSFRSEPELLMFRMRWEF